MDLAAGETLRIHDETKHVGVSYSCEKCEYKTATRTDLKEHVESYHEETRYTCEQCEYETTELCNLKVHKRQIHQKEQWGEVLGKMRKPEIIQKKVRIRKKKIDEKIEGKTIQMRLRTKTIPKIAQNAIEIRMQKENKNLNPNLDMPQRIQKLIPHMSTDKNFSFRF